MPAQGGTPRKLFSAPALVLLTDWSNDGRRLLYQMAGDGTREDLWTTTIDAASPVPFAATRAGERQARFSPDTRYVAYSSDESGRPEVYVQPFPPTGAKWRISNDGGHQPTWRHDGQELYYLSGDRRLIAVPVHLAREVTTGAPSELFRIPRDAPIEGRISYAPSSDGQRFLVNLAAPDRVRQPTFETQVVVNWPSTVSGTR